MKNIKCWIFVGIILALSFSVPVHAEEGTPCQWKVSVTPFAWLMGMDGTVNVKGHSADVKMNFSDIFDAMDATGEVNIEASNGIYGFFVQPNYMKLVADAKATLPLSGTEVKSKLTSTNLFMEFAGFARLVDIERASGGHNTIDVIGGLRYWDMENESKLSVPVTGESRTVTSETTFLDPFVGLRMKAYMADRVPYSLRADIGGLNTGSSSTTTYNLQALLGYEVTQRIIVFGGYRVMYVDYGDKDAGFDLMQSGPALGSTVTF